MDNHHTRIIKTVCARDCPDSCFLEVSIKDGKIGEVRASFDNPVTNGLTCPRAAGDAKRVYSPDRVKSPLIKTGSKNKVYKKASWEKALDLVSNELEDVISEYGPEKVLLLDYAGNTGYLTTGFSKRLWNLIGATKTDYAVCSASGHAALNLHYGLSYGCQPQELMEKRVIIFWGFNAKVSSPHQWALAERARREQGAVIITVDPRLSETANSSDLWINPLPGSDVALAYGLAQWLITNDQIDTEFIEKWTFGYEQYKEEALKWTPEKVEKFTGLGEGELDKFGKLLVSDPSVVFMLGIGLNKSATGAESIRTVSLLPALLGVHRGFYYSNSRGRFIGDISLDNHSKGSKIVSQVSLGKRLLEGEFKFVYITCMNPVLTLPDSKSITAGLERHDVFVCVHDTHFTDTCNFAEVVLPAPTYLEKKDIVVCDSHPYVRLSSSTIQPQHNSKDEIWVMRQIARRIGIEDKRIYVDQWDELNRIFEKSFTDGTFKDLFNGKVLTLRKKPNEAYQTLSGKIEFSSKTAPPDHNPLPVQMHIGRTSNEFILLNSALPKWTHTQFTDVYGEIPSEVWINPKDAEKLGIKAGNKLKVANNDSMLELNSIVTDRVGEGVLWMPREVKDINGVIQNSLTPGTPQKLGGGPVFNSVKVQIIKE
jgi:anaerobic selenocysteine-containing dehydrogenase